MSAVITALCVFVCVHYVLMCVGLGKLTNWHSKKRYVRRNIRLSCVKGNTEKTENTIVKNTQCKNDTVFSVINRCRNNNNLGGSISARVNIIIMIGSG